MTNIYNKIYHNPNGTLIANWYEEQCLRDKTDCGRNIPATHIPKRSGDFSWDIPYDAEMRDDTFTRTIGDRPYHEWWTTNSTYGDFSKSEANKKLHLTFEDKIYNDFFKSYSGKPDPVPLPKPKEDPQIKMRIEYLQKMQSTEESFNKKLREIFVEKGWMAIRQYKNYFKVLSPHHDNYIHRDDLKNYFMNYGIYLDTKEIQYIYFRFQNPKNEIDYNGIFNSAIFIPVDRFETIKTAIENLHNLNGNQEKFEKKWLIKIMRPGVHPEVISGKRVAKEIVKQYEDAFDEKTTMIDDRELVQLLCEISFCTPEDKDFENILKSLGMA